MRIVAAVLGAVLGAAICAAALPGRAEPVRVASKTSSEQVILGEIYAAALERSGIPVERRIAIGGTRIAHNALAGGEIDLYPEYTGTAVKSVLKVPPIHDPATAYRTVKAFYESELEITWLKPSGINNGPAMVVRADTAERHKLVTLSDLASVSKRFRLGAGPEFADRTDGLPGLRMKYGIEFAELIAIDALTPRYKALGSGELETVTGFDTDWQIAAGGFVTLEDDRNLFQPYYVTPVVRMETVASHPRLEAVLNRVSALLDNAAMRDLRLRVEMKKQQPRDVAAEFLRSKGPIR